MKYLGQLRFLNILPLSLFIQLKDILLLSKITYEEMGTSIGLPERPDIKGKKWNLQTLKVTSGESKNWVRLQQLQTRQSIGRPYRLHEPARNEERPCKTDVELCQWNILRITHVHLAALLRLPHVPQQKDNILKWRLEHWVPQLLLRTPNNSNNNNNKKFPKGGAAQSLLS